MLDSSMGLPYITAQSVNQAAGCSKITGLKPAEPNASPKPRYIVRAATRRAFGVKLGAAGVVSMAILSIGLANQLRWRCRHNSCSSGKCDEEKEYLELVFSGSK